MSKHRDLWIAAGAGSGVLAFLLGSLWLGSALAAEPVPFVGCPAEGLSGPVPAPAAPAASVQGRVAHAGQLALYGTEGLQVLAPRGWHCIGTYGSGGASLLVTPQPYTAATLPGFNELTGPAVELSLLSGENSGRDQVAEVFARLFPSKRAFIRKAAESRDTPPRYPRGPYPGDSTIRRGRARVDYVTPPGHDGMGTYASRLRPGPEPILGTATLAQVQGVDSVALLNVRLPPYLHALGPVILRTTAAAGAGRNLVP